MSRKGLSQFSGLYYAIECMVEYICKHQDDGRSREGSITVGCNGEEGSDNVMSWNGTHTSTQSRLTPT